jgi:hypothetical protein
MMAMDPLRITTSRSSTRRTNREGHVLSSNHCGASERGEPYATTTSETDVDVDHSAAPESVSGIWCGSGKSAHAQAGSRDGFESEALQLVANYEADGGLDDGGLDDDDRGASSGGPRSPPWCHANGVTSVQHAAWASAAAENELLLKNASLYVASVRRTFAHAPEVVAAFEHVLQIRSGCCFGARFSVSGAVLLISALFEGHADLIAGFVAFFVPTSAPKQCSILFGDGEGIASRIRNDVGGSSSGGFDGDCGDVGGSSGSGTGSDRGDGDGEAGGTGAGGASRMAAMTQSEFNYMAHYPNRVTQRFANDPSALRSFAEIVAAIVHGRATVAESYPGVKRLFGRDQDLFDEFARIFPL